jgi:hypothetical protein
MNELLIKPRANNTFDVFESLIKRATCNYRRAVDPVDPNCPQHGREPRWRRCQMLRVPPLAQ